MQTSDLKYLIKYKQVVFPVKTFKIIERKKFSWSDLTVSNNYFAQLILKCQYHINFFQVCIWSLDFFFFKKDYLNGICYFYCII